MQILSFKVLLKARGFDAMFCIIAVHGVDLLHCTPGTGC